MKPNKEMEQEMMRNRMMKQKMREQMLKKNQHHHDMDDSAHRGDPLMRAVRRQKNMPTENFK